MDYSRPAPPQGNWDLARGAPPEQRLTETYLLPFVLLFAFLGALWSLFSAIGFFRAINIDKAEHPQLSTFSIALGALYMGVCVIEIIGVVGSAMQKLALVRIYALASVLAFVIVLAAGIMRIVIHFQFKDVLIKECSDSTNGRTIVFRYGLFGPITSDTINPEEADRWCRRAWDRDSWGEIVSLLIILFLAGMFASIAFAYYRQVLDPSSPANASRAPSSQVRAAGYPTYYNPPYNASAVPNLGYSQPPQQYPPPPGPPPQHRDETFVPPYDGKPPGYGAGDSGDFIGGKDDKENPFADFDERDVTSRPGPGGRDAF
ncbi:hypothetical protein CCMSSC00406_0003367 [Pleurotus cornucopiae]|uniref:Uncharacterized protein n=1 Tax=Pleurotus cornucopiae TaxID=5321 RepID=A0ACB7J9N1_PLECO|nr:hypothetical protein CCMSSC00406_0003367 [Pleurotus cornucopiae]